MYIHTYIHILEYVYEDGVRDALHERGRGPN